MLSFAASLPYHDSIVSACKKGDSKLVKKSFVDLGKKINGLVFLHALTLVQMTPPEEASGEEELSAILTSLDTCYQIDVKMKLSLMSHRSFSSMYKDIREDMRIPYTTYFEESILQFNKRFTSFFEVPGLFRLTSYGEQFFDHAENSLMSLERLMIMPAFQSQFF